MALSFTRLGNSLTLLQPLQKGLSNVNEAQTLENDVATRDYAKLLSIVFGSVMQVETVIEVGILALWEFSNTAQEIREATVTFKRAVDN